MLQGGLPLPFEVECHGTAERCCCHPEHGFSIQAGQILFAADRMSSERRRIASFMPHDPRQPQREVGVVTEQGVHVPTHWRQLRPVANANDGGVRVRQPLQ